MLAAADAILVLCSYHNQPGIEIRPYDFGGLGGIYSIDPDLPNWSSTYKPIIDKLQMLGTKKERICLELHMTSDWQGMALHRSVS